MMIGVIGGDPAADDALALAEEVGRELALAGDTIVCGGRGGVMEAACRGARLAGGHTVGVLPGIDPREANPHVEFPIATGIGVARNAIVVHSSDALIAVDGGYGTLSEIAIALQFRVPVVALDSWRFSVGSREDPPIVRARSAAEAVAVARSLAAARTQVPHG